MGKLIYFDPMNCFRAGTRAKNIRLKRRAIRKHPGLIGSKKKKAFAIKITSKKNKIFRIICT